MANENQYYAPIIQAYLEATKNAQTAGNAIEERKARLQELAMRQKESDAQLDQAQQRIDEERDFHHSEIDNQASLRKAATDKAHLDTSKMVADLINSGAKPEAAAALVGGKYNAPTPTGNPGINAPQNPATIQAYEGAPQIPVSGLQTLQQRQADELEQFKKHTQVQYEAEEPFKQAARNQTEKEKTDALVNAAKLETDREDRSDERQNKLLKNERDIAAIRIKSAESKQLSPAEQQALENGMATGQFKVNPANPHETQAYTNLLTKGGRAIDPKDAESLRQLAAVDPVLDRMEKFADTYLPESKPGAMLNGIKLASPYPSDGQNELKLIQSQASQVGKALDGVTSGRIPFQQVQQLMEGMARGNITKDQMKENIDNFKTLYTNKEKNVIMGGLPDTQTKLIRDTYGIKPPPAPPTTPVAPPIQGSLPGGGQIPTPGVASPTATAPAPPAVNKLGHKLNPTLTQQEGRPIYDPTL
jgi:hypothetical protein